MRNMSFALTTEQVKARTKTVTRRLGWKNAKRGDVIQPVVKGMGLKKGEKVERIGGPIRIVCVTREPLNAMHNEQLYGLREASREGFPHLTGKQFVAFFCEHNGCTPDTEVTRIEFEYV
jgi:hypothetical protein